MTDARYERPDILAQLVPGRAGVIEASAGTGKTFTIEHLVVDLILREGARIDGVLVVTFTEKATLELRARIRALLVKVLEARPTRRPPASSWVIDDVARSRLRAAIAGFETASIYTIHGFCQRILAEHAFLHRRPFEQDVVDGRRAFGRAFRDVLRRTLAVDEATSGMLAHFVATRSLDKLEGLLHDAYARGGPSGAPPVTGLAPRIDEELTKALFRLGPSVKKGKLGEVRALLLDREGRTPEALAQAAGMLANARDAQGRDARRVRRLVLLAAPLPPPEDGLEADVVRAMLPAVAAELARSKASLGHVDFDDMLRGVHDGLFGPSGDSLAQAIRERYSHAIIDEFQDTDRTQWDVFHRVFVPPSAPSTLYVIGDPKQAIYAFRGADVFTYLEAKDELARLGAPVLSLATNHRSSRSMIAAINELFSDAQEAPILDGLLTYDTPVSYGGRAPEAKRGGKPLAPVTIARLPDVSGGLSSREARDLYGRFVATEIARMLSSPRERIVAGDAKLSARDVMVLGFTGAECMEIAGHLRRANVPHALFKQDGLFQGEEAADVRDLFAALADPHDPGKRLLALATPFFAVPWTELARCRDLAPSHPIAERLARWTSLAADMRWAELVPALIEESGLSRRELLVGDDARQLEAYVQVLRAVLDEAEQGRRTAAEMYALMAAFVRGTASPAEGRLATRPAGEDDAVQIMTVHKSKGLEAPVVFLFGGLFSLTRYGGVDVVHEGFRRVLSIGRPSETGKAKLTAERAEERQRLVYVALTRAKYRMVLPLVRGTRKLQGAYATVNDQLVRIVAEQSFRPELRETFAVETLDPVRLRRATWQQQGLSLGLFAPSPEDLAEPASPVDMDALARDHAPITITSYTADKRSGGGYVAPTLDDARSEDGSRVAAAPGTLPGGRTTGRLLHDLLERVPPSSFVLAEPAEAWARRPEIAELVQSTLVRYGGASSHAPEVARLVHAALGAALSVGTLTVPRLASARLVREMELVFPLPADGHALLGALAEDHDAADDAPRFRADRGFVRGFVDLVFEHEGKIGVVDWKSDVLPAYDTASLAEHATRNYLMQAHVYGVGVVRLLGIRTEAEYERRFAGLSFVFLRGGTAEAAACWTVRPSFAELARIERDLFAEAP